jgi:hypothetical protein
MIFFQVISGINRGSSCGHHMLVASFMLVSYSTFIVFYSSRVNFGVTHFIKFMFVYVYCSYIS